MLDGDRHGREPVVCHGRLRWLGPGDQGRQTHRRQLGYRAVSGGHQSDPLPEPGAAVLLGATPILTAMAPLDCPPRPSPLRGWGSPGSAVPDRPTLQAIFKIILGEFPGTHRRPRLAHGLGPATLRCIQLRRSKEPVGRTIGTGRRWRKEFVRSPYTTAFRDAGSRSSTSR
jgi:hypothetical protein